jgi:hypothetical protein
MGRAIRRTNVTAMGFSEQGVVGPCRRKANAQMERAAKPYGYVIRKTTFEFLHLIAAFHILLQK